MPIKKDGTGKRWVEMEFIAPGTPEQVWRAMATGPGNTAWFTKTAIEERVGGEIRFEFAAMGTSKGEITAWQPPLRFDYVERDWSPGAPPVATEITITARAGGQCVVRMVHSLFTSSDDWDNQMEGFEGGWPSFFDVLRVYLTHFAGQKAAQSQVMVPAQGDALTVWRRLTQALGLEGVNAGERRTTPNEPESLSGIVERVQQDGKGRLIMLRLDKPTTGVALISTFSWGQTVNVGVTLYYYGGAAEKLAAESEANWRTWLTTTFPPPKRA
jgi:uncharacterized protein YndB with AHSA1/START domain